MSFPSLQWITNKTGCIGKLLGSRQEWNHTSNNGDQQCQKIGLNHWLPIQGTIFENRPSPESKNRGQHNGDLGIAQRESRCRETQKNNFSRRAALSHRQNSTEKERRKNKCHEHSLMLINRTTYRHDGNQQIKSRSNQTNQTVPTQFPDKGVHGNQGDRRKENRHKPKRGHHTKNSPKQLHPEREKSYAQTRHIHRCQVLPEHIVRRPPRGTMSENSLENIRVTSGIRKSFLS